MLNRWGYLPCATVASGSATWGIALCSAVGLPRDAMNPLDFSCGVGLFCTRQAISVSVAIDAVWQGGFRSSFILFYLGATKSLEDVDP